MAKQEKRSELSIYPPDVQTHTTQDEREQGCIRYMLSENYIRRISSILKTYPQFTRALAEEYFTGSLLNDATYFILFKRGANQYSVGYEDRLDEYGGFTKKLEVIIRGSERTEQITVVTATWLNQPTDGLSQFDGAFSYKHSGPETTTVYSNAEEADRRVQQFIFGPGHKQWYDP